MRNAQSIIIWVIFLVWVSFCVYAIDKLGVDVWQALGLGVITGVLLAMLKDMWQFYWRKKGT